MIDAKRFADLSNEMQDIMGMNSDDINIGFDNKDIMKHVKNSYDEQTGFVDTLTFFKG